MVSKQLLEDMTRRLVAEFAPERVLLFGSQAWGSPASDSDVDFMVIVACDTEAAAQTSFQRGLRARRVLRDFPVAKDVVVETRDEFDFRSLVKGSLERQIAENGQVLYG